MNQVIGQCQCPYQKFHLDFAKYTDYCNYCGHSPIIKRIRRIEARINWRELG